MLNDVGDVIQVDGVLIIVFNYVFTAVVYIFHALRNILM